MPGNDTSSNYNSEHRQEKLKLIGDINRQLGNMGLPYGDMYSCYCFATRMFMIADMMLDLADVQQPNLRYFQGLLAHIDEAIKLDNAEPGKWRNNDRLALFYIKSAAVLKTGIDLLKKCEKVSALFANLEAKYQDYAEKCLVRLRSTFQQYRGQSDEQILYNCYKEKSQEERLKPIFKGTYEARASHYHYQLQLKLIQQNFGAPVPAQKQDIVLTNRHHRKGGEHQPLLAAGGAGMTELVDLRSDTLSQSRPVYVGSGDRPQKTGGCSIM